MQKSVDTPVFSVILVIIERDNLKQKKLVETNLIEEKKGLTD